MTQWFAIRTATRQELKAVTSLRELDIFAYCPVETRWRRTPRTRTKADVPLFTGYIFAQLDAVGIALAHEADGVHAVVGAFRDRPTIEAGKIEALQQAQADGLFDHTLSDPPIKAFSKGEKLKVIDGPFSGWIGEVTRAKGKNRLMLMTQMFGRKREIELPVGSLAAA